MPKGDRRGRHSIRINEHWRVCFRWKREVLREEFLLPMGISQNALARAAGVPPRRINEIVLGKRGVSADSAVRVAAALGTSERFWLGLQSDFDLDEARRALGKSLSRIARLAA